MSAACPHDGLRLVTPDEEPTLQERLRRPYTCEDCGGVSNSRFTQGQAFMLLWARLHALADAIAKERPHATSKR
jgi:hypothetical protein